MTLESIRNFLCLSDGTGTAGQPTEDQFAAIKAAGYELVINLRPPVADAPPNEREIVEALGMKYVHIPVDWEAPAVEDAEQFFAIMAANADKRAFVHCAMNMRVSAFMYLYRVLHRNIPPEEAANDLHRLWEPNATWQRFIEQVIAAHQHSA